MTTQWMWRALFAVAAWLACPHDAAAQACSISTTPVAFGNYSVFTATDTDSTGTVTYKCNASINAATVTLSKGVSSTYSPRTLLKGAEALNYNLYRNAARTQIAGDGTAGTFLLFNGNPPNNVIQNLTVYGRIPAQQDVSAGPYTDTVVATINF